MKHRGMKYFFTGLAFLLTNLSLVLGNTISKVDVEEMAINDTIRVMSYNIHHCDPPYVTGDTPKIDTTIAVIAKQNPDIVALQEVDMNTNRSGNVHQAKVIAERLGMNFYFAAAKSVTGGKYGVAILSKFAISEATTLVLPFPDTSGEVRVLATVKIILPDGTAIRFGCTHFDLVTENKKAEIAKVVEVAAAEPLPFIIAGDLNSWENSGVIATLDTKFTRTCHGCPPTSPAKNPQNTIDYIAFRHPENKFSIINHRTVNETYASDHRPIVADIAYQRSNTEPSGLNTPGIAPVKLIGRKLISEEPTSISLYNLLGILLYQQKVNTSFEIPARIGKGIYLVKSSKGSNKIILE